MVAAYQAIGTFAESITTISPAWPAHQTDDIGLLVVESCGGEPVTLSTPAGFAACANSPQATGAGTAGTQVSVFWCRATSGAMGAPTVADPGDHVYGGIVTVRGAQTWGDPFEATAGGVKAGASTAFSITTFTNNTADMAYIGVCARDTDSAVAAFSGETNASLTSLTERLDLGTALGNGGGLAVYSGIRAATGTVSATTGTVSSSINAVWACGIKSAISPIYPGQGAAGGCRVIHYEGFDLPDSSAVTALVTGAWTSAAAGATVDIQNGALQVATGTAGAYTEAGGAIMGYPLPIGANWEVQFEYRWTTVANDSAGRVSFGDVQQSGGFPTNGFGIQIGQNDNTIYLSRRVANATTNVTTGAFTNVATRRVGVRFRRLRTSLFVKVWALPDPEPAAWLLMAHGEATGLGVDYSRFMLGMNGGNAAVVNTIRYDNVYISVLDRAGRPGRLPR